MDSFPEEVDLFALPHESIRRMIDEYCLKQSLTNYQDAKEVESLLNDLKQVAIQVKTHEEIENKYIMQKLDGVTKLNVSKPSSGLAVLDTHLANMLALLRDGCPCCQDQIPKQVCSRYEHHLRQALENFTSNFFLHMKEEEEVVQPILMENVDYEELKTMRQVVLNHHEWTHEGLLPSTALPPLAVSKKRMKELEELDFETENWETEESKWYREDRLLHSTDVKKRNVNYCDFGPFGGLPVELKLHVFSYLTHPELELCAKICSEWEELAFHPAFWRVLDPVRWAKDGAPKPSVYGSGAFGIYDLEDVDCNDGTENRILNLLLKKVVAHDGLQVHTMVLSGCMGLTSEQLRTFLAACVNLSYLDISYTTVSSMAFAGLSPPSCSNLRHLDASGNIYITDGILFRLARLWETSLAIGEGGPKLGLQYLNVSGCFRVTIYGLARLAMSGMLFPLLYLDLSGCANLMGKDVAWIAAHCPQLKSNRLFYCDNVGDGPHPHSDNGCRNVGSRRRFCCRKD